MSKAETDRATALVLKAGRWGVMGREIVSADGTGLGAIHTDANAALIVERVNGWDELVAERDRLRAIVALSPSQVRQVEDAADRLIEVIAERNRLGTALSAIIQRIKGSDCGEDVCSDVLDIALTGLNGGVR